MKIYGIKKWARAALISCMFVLVISAAPALAGEDGMTGRQIYDLVMLIFNFCILVFIIWKYGRKPIANFLKGQGQLVADRLMEFEDKKEAAQREMLEAKEKLANFEEHAKKIHQHAEDRGQRQRQILIDQAQQESESLMSGAREKMANQIQEAKKNLRGELLDMAVDIATQKLPEVMTADDEKKILAEYLEKAGSTA